jgi:hypothetical protein
MFAYYSKLSSMISALVPLALSDQRTADNLIVAHFIYKCLVKMALWLWPRLSQPGGGFAKLEPWVCVFYATIYDVTDRPSTIQFLQLFESSTGQLKILSELRINLVLALRASGASDRLTLLSVDRLTRHVRVFGKFFRRLQQLKPDKFVQLPTGNQIVLYYWDRVVQATNGPPELIQGSEFNSTRMLALLIILHRRSDGGFPGAFSPPGHGPVQGKSLEMDAVSQRWPQNRD